MKLFKSIIAASLLLGLGSTSAFAYHGAPGYGPNGTYNKKVVVRTTKYNKKFVRRGPRGRVIVKKVYRPAPKLRRTFVQPRYYRPELTRRPVPRFVKVRPHVRVKRVVKVHRHYR